MYLFAVDCAVHFQNLDCKIKEIKKNSVILQIAYNTNRDLGWFKLLV